MDAAYLYLYFFAFVPDLAGNGFEDSLRTVGENKIGNILQMPKLKELMDFVLADKEKNGEGGI